MKYLIIRPSLRIYKRGPWDQFIFSKDMYTIKWTLVDLHDDVIKWKHFPGYWPSVLGIHRSPVNSPHKGQWRGTLMFPFIYVWINGLVNNRKAGDLRRHHAHYDVTVMLDMVSDCILHKTMGWLLIQALISIEPWHLNGLLVNGYMACSRSSRFIIYR